MVPAPIRTLTTVDEARALVREARQAGRRVALVPTMGALHAGHAALVRTALEEADLVIASIFVNPMQFGPHEDLDRYPRTPDADLAALADLGVTAAFMPTVDEMYPDGGRSATLVTAGHLGTVLEGRSRPGHFDGVLTVVTKLLSIVTPDVAVFGEKDGQQLFLVRRMVRDLDLPVRVIGVPTVREPDGLALSSRNRLLQAGERDDALALSRALRAAGKAADRGVEAMLAAAQAVFQDETGVRLDYLAVVDPRTFLGASDDHHGPVQVLVAARVGTVRLIDNAVFTIP
ncbi:pantoate--beta-alanine ligase [Agrococcus sp. HG114]|uniref:pantoate--beta-alanine ligase n=1 Tax=Agrococcus sp. HG114 TaxID=2969757 RepID=UPI00215A4DCF|nr:pantoate--beta-alanine ligase [Agrococcus sp. HG114]MCR8671893.1 pantoate--beta-alanine ligase [Agrococcus sp. HG114]